MLSETRARRSRRDARAHLASNPELSLHNSQRLLAAGLVDAETLELAITALLALRRLRPGSATHGAITPAVRTGRRRVRGVDQHLFRYR